MHIIIRNFERVKLQTLVGHFQLPPSDFEPNSKLVTSAEVVRGKREVVPTETCKFELQQEHACLVKKEVGWRVYKNKNKLCISGGLIRILQVETRLKNEHA